MGKIIGITGGIASGKSTVTNFLRKQGFQVVDADVLVHQLQKPGGRLFEALVQHFDQKIILENGGKGSKEKEKAAKGCRAGGSSGGGRSCCHYCGGRKYSRT